MILGGFERTTREVLHGRCAFCRARVVRQKISKAPLLNATAFFVNVIRVFRLRYAQYSRSARTATTIYQKQIIVALVPSSTACFCLTGHGLQLFAPQSYPLSSRLPTVHVSSSLLFLSPCWPTKNVPNLRRLFLLLHWDLPF